MINKIGRIAARSLQEIANYFKWGINDANIVIITFPRGVGRITVGNSHLWLTCYQNRKVNNKTKNNDAIH